MDKNNNDRPPRTVSLGLVLRIPADDIPELLRYLRENEDTKVVFALESHLRLLVEEVPWSTA